MTDNKLSPNDPTPDPEAPPPAPPPAPRSLQDVVDDVKTAGKVVCASVSAGEKIAEDGKIDAEEIVDAALEVAEALPLSHHAITELRKLLVPIITAIIAAAVGGGVGTWQAGMAKDEAVIEAEKRAGEIIREAEARTRELEKLRGELRKAILKEASWDEVGTQLKVDKPRVLEEFLLTPAAKNLKQGELSALYRDELQQLQAQTALPPRPGPR